MNVSIFIRINCFVGRNEELTTWSYEITRGMQCQLALCIASLFWTCGANQVEDNNAKFGCQVGVEI